MHWKALYKNSTSEQVLKLLRRVGLGVKVEWDRIGGCWSEGRIGVGVKVELVLG